MSQEKVETTTIVRDGNTIIIAHPPVKKQTNYWELITGWFNQQTLKDEASHVQETIILPVQEQKTIEIPVPPPQEVEKSVQKIVQPVHIQASESWAQFTNFFSRQNLSSYKKQINQQIASLDGIDDRLSKGISKFKQQNFMIFGDVRFRSILMGFYSTLLYKIVSSNQTGFLKKSRNFAGCFIFVSYWLVPQLLNPFLRRPNLASNIV